MVDDKLYDLAFRCRSVKLWKLLTEEELFAVRLSDGEIAYCNVVGAAGELYGISVYLGEEGLRSYRQIIRTAHAVEEPDIQESLMHLDCMQCIYENSTEFSPEYVERVRQYARDHQISLRGRKMFPYFVRYRSARLPKELEDAADQAILCEVMEAILALGEALATTSKKALGFAPTYLEQQEIPLLVRNETGYAFDKFLLAAETKKEYPQPQLKNDLIAAKIKRGKKRGKLFAAVCQVPQLVYSEEDDTAWFPTVLLALRVEEHEICDVEPVLDYEQQAEELLDRFAAMLLEKGRYPAAIYVQDDCTQSFFQHFCQQTGIRLERSAHIPELEDLKQDFNSFIAEPDLEEMDEFGGDIGTMLMNVDPDDLRKMPEEILEMLLGLIDDGILPKEVEEKVLNSLFEQKAKGKRKKKTAAKPKRKVSGSYVISVSQGTGCYRHIQISAGATLFQLHEAILEAFEFVDDHAHAFFMDNRTWSQVEAYYVSWLENEDETCQKTDEVCLGQLKLEDGKAFKYVFDFGDEWVFQCKVLKHLDVATMEAMVVREKGEAPDQYHFFDEADGEWEDE